MIKDVFQNFNFFADGRGYAGRIEEFTPPKIVAKMIEYDGGGLGAVVDVPSGSFEKLEAEATIKAQDKDIFTLLGVVPGNTYAFTAKGALADANGTRHAVQHKMRAHIAELDPGTWKKNDSAEIKLKLTLHYYQYEYDGVELVEIDPINMIAKINGVDQLAETRKAIGL
ncbi:phage major tail tube protein [Paracoccaceae bacterium GXU_MW_L88]